MRRMKVSVICQSKVHARVHVSYPRDLQVDTLIPKLITKGIEEFGFLTKRERQREAD